MDGTEDLWPKGIKTFSARIIVENKVERILEMSFDHTAAMISLLRTEEMELKADSYHHIVYARCRRVLHQNIDALKTILENLKDGKGSKLDLFQRKCQEFGI